MYQALYRKYRPRTFSEVVGQSHITDTLQRQVAEGRVGHAYLFTGTRGTGKTTCARILAKAVNCERPVDGAPCCQCDSCRGIDAGALLDVTELDAASNGSVNDARTLREEAVYPPSVLKKRVYIIDEVHMLSRDAFNALLKIMEEPPEHLLFILATTELHKVPATILSRCQRFSFKRILPRDMEQQLLKIAAAEDIALTADGAEILARMANGALRDALSLLDQCRAVEGNIDSRTVLDTLGLAGSTQTLQLMRCLLARNAADALALFDRLYRGGKDVAALLGELSDLARDMTVMKAAPAATPTTWERSERSSRVTIELSLLLSGISVAFAIFFGISNKKRNDKKDAEQETEERATANTLMMTKLENIADDVKDIKRDYKETRAEVQDLHDRVLIVEQSLKSYHKRLDGMNLNIKTDQ